MALSRSTPEKEGCHMPGEPGLPGLGEIGTKLQLQPDFLGNLF
jgi:hypothetical protein